MEDFPTLDFVPVSEALTQVSTVIGSLAHAVSIVGAIALLSGVFVLAGALAAGRRQREADAIVTKVLAGRPADQIASAFLLEYGLLGLLATIAAAGLGSLAAWAVASNVIDVPFFLDLPLIVEVALGAVVVTIVTGLLTTLVGADSTARRIPAGSWSDSFECWRPCCPITEREANRRLLGRSQAATLKSATGAEWSPRAWFRMEVP